MIQWHRLTPQSKQTLRQIGLLIYAGYSEQEVALRLNMPVQIVKLRLSVLRNELEAQP